MDKFATLEPVKLYSSAASTGARLLSRATGHKPIETEPAAPPLVGLLPQDLHLLILSHLPVPDIAAYSRCSRATAAFARSEALWEKRWRALGIDTDFAFRKVLDTLERKANEKTTLTRASAPPIIPVDDEFGDFTTADADVFVQPPEDEMGDFVGAFQNVHSIPIIAPPMSASVPPKDTSLTKYTRAHTLLKPLTRILASPPHVVLSDLAQELSSSLYDQAKMLRLLSSFLSPRIQPVRKWDVLYASLRTAMDRFDSSLLAAFDVADSKGDEEGMREAAESSWEVWDAAAGGDWEMGKVWAEKREIFYQQGRWRALDNFTAEGDLDFAPMDEFIDTILHSLTHDGALSTRVFPPASQVLIAFADRLAVEVVGEYITTLLSHAREISNEVYLRATAASFREAWKMVEAIVEAAGVGGREGSVDRHKAEDVVYRMFEANMDEYLDEEVESVKIAFDTICKSWDREASTSPTSPTTPHTRHFLTPHQNPALLKRTVLASFTNLLLLPVTIVPRTVGAVGGALMTGGSAAVQGIAMLNPQRWVGGGAGRGVINGGINNGNGFGGNGVGNGEYSKDLERTKVDAFFEDEEDGDDDGGDGEYYPPAVDGAKERKSNTPAHLDIKSPTPLLSNSGGITPSTAGTANTTDGSSHQPQQLDLLLSLDVALSLIHADREALKRVETFAGYPGHYGHRVRDTIEELFILMLKAVGEGHVAKGFARATEQMRDYKPGESSDTTNVAPLVQFFELVHIGDTIQSITQVYFEKELAHHIDKTDFMNAVVREKKRFENSLDDSVATGLNAGTEVLMNQVEHIILTLTKPREYYPPEDTPLELGPTKGCQEAIRCLENHCKLLKGSTSKEVLEVFYQEVGLRLIGILQKHIKRQIISLTGGFQVIADLNAYNAFIASLKVSAISAEFAHLRMLGHVYVVEDAKDLAQIVKDVARYGGAYRPEDIYEFIQRRSDWKKIEKVVDKTMYNLSFKEDCTVC